MIKKYLKWCTLLSFSLLVLGCANAPVEKDYSAFEAAKPRSILILPPTNLSPEIKATNSVYSQVSFPVGESGYYVLPVGVVYETFVSNGLHQAEDIQKVSLKKLNEIFSADAILYLNINDFGSTYQVISSTAQVGLEGRLIDAKTGKLLWEGKARAVEQSDSSNGILGSMITALIKQIADTSSNRSHILVPQASSDLLSAAKTGGLLYGPYAPQEEEPKE